MKSRIAATLAMVLLSSSLTAQLAPHNRLIRFSLPSYNAESYREWTLSGEEGNYKEDSLFEVSGMRLTIFSGDAHQLLETVIESDEAVFDLAENRATSDAPIHISSPSFDIRGEGWSWDSAQGRVTIDRSVTIRFSQKLDLDLNNLL